MIFKTITNDLNGAINKIGIFNRIFADLKNSISANGIRGLFNSISPVITSNDISLIKEYNHLVGVEGVSSQSAWYRTMLSSSRSAQALFDDEHNLIRTNNGLILSEEALVRTTNTMTIGAKAASVALKALSIAGNIITFAAIAKGIQLATTAIDNWIHRVEKANEAMSEAVSDYESAKTSLENINKELEEQNQKINELLSKDKLTYAEKGQLEELQEITKELLLQQDIEKRHTEKASKEAADKTVKAYKKQYGKYDTSKEYLNEQLEFQNTYGNFAVPTSDNDITGNIAAYIRTTELLAEAQKNHENALKNGEDTTFFIDDIQDYIDTVDDFSEILDDNITDLQEKRLALEDEYNKAIEKRQNGTEPLTSSENDIISTYESIYDTIKLIYEYTNQNDWNNMEIANIFNTNGIEKTKEELIAVAKSGELTRETIEGYTNLNNAINESEIFLRNGQTAAEAFCEEIYGCVTATDEIKESINDIDSPLSLSDLLNTEDLADTKKELIELAKAGELTPETFNSTKEYRDLLRQTGLTAKQAYLEMMNLDDFDMDLSDWQSQLQNARSNISELNDIIDELTSKDSTGLSSSSVDKIISDFPQLLQYLNDTPRLIEEINSLLNGQKDIANDAANQMLEYNSSAYIQMRDTAQAAINDITVMQNGQVQSVAQMYGIDLNNYSSLAQAKKAIELALLGTLNEGWAQHFGVVIDSLTGMAKITQSLDGSDPRTAEALSQISAYNELMTRLNSAKKNFESNIDYGSVGANKSKSKGSDKKETDKWLEEYKKKLAELQNQLDKGKRKCPLL